MKFRTQYNYDYTTTLYEKNTIPSKTIPDQTMSISEIMRRFTKGLPIESAKAEVWDGEEDLPDTRKMDLSEIQEMKENLQQRINEQQHELQFQEQRRQERKKRNQQPPAQLPPPVQPTT